MRYFYFLLLVLIGYDYYKNVIATTNEVKERPFLAFDISACSNSVQLVPLQPIIISILFHHYKELKECISEVEQMEARANSSKKKEWLTIIREEQQNQDEREKMLPATTTMDGYFI